MRHPFPHELIYVVAIIDYASNYSMRQRKTKVNMLLLCKPANSQDIQPDIQGKYTEMILLRDSFIQLKKSSKFNL